MLETFSSFTLDPQVLGHLVHVECTLTVFERNANVFSLNAMVDVRRRRHEMIVFNISETTKPSNFKI